MWSSPEFISCLFHRVSDKNIKLYLPPHSGTDPSNIFRQKALIYVNNSYYHARLYDVLDYICEGEFVYRYEKEHFIWDKRSNDAYVHRV